MNYDRLSGPQRKVLRDAIAGLFPDRRDLDMFLEDAGHDRLDNVADQGNYKFQLFDFLRRYSAQGKLNPLIQQIQTEFPNSPDVIELNARLSLVEDGSPQKQRVALTQGGLERVVRNSGEADLYLWTDKLLAFGRSICRIRYPTDTGILYGTGFLIGPNLVLTNFHVIEALILNNARPDEVRVRFDYAERAATREEGIDYCLAHDWLGPCSPYSQADLDVDAGTPAAHELDFAVIRLADLAGLAKTETGLERSWIELPQMDVPLDGGAIVFILQHPDGEPIKQTIGITMNSPTTFRLRYDADTESGSSGALVLDARLQPIALHHAGDPDAKIKARYNQGIPLGLIRAAIDASVLP